MGKKNGEGIGSKNVESEGGGAGRERGESGERGGHMAGGRGRQQAGRDSSAGGSHEVRMPPSLWSERRLAIGSDNTIHPHDSLSEWPTLRKGRVPLTLTI
jgi:hypothetical protein